MIIKMTKYTVLSLISMFVVLFACNAPEREPYHTVQDKIDEDGHDGDTTYGVLSTDYLEYLETVHTDSAFVGEKFLITKRSSKIAKFQCSQCHTKDLDELKKLKEGQKKAHWDLKLMHANHTTMNCGTCHNPNSMDSLRTLTGESVSFDHSYKTCAQCHSTQYKDWKIGTHGKRQGGWAPPRVSKTCADCHDPHQPAFEKRHPALINSRMLQKHRVDIDDKKGH